MKNLSFALFLGLISVLNLSGAQAQELPPMDPDAEFRAYCDLTLRNLERARVHAAQFSRRGDFAGASRVLLDGLRGSSSPYGEVNPVTLNLMGHAFSLGSTLYNEVGSSIKGLKVTTIALEGFYDLIFKTAQKIDYQYYHCGSYRRNCRYARTLQFENDLLEMARDMLALVNGTLTIRSGSQVFPLGTTKSYLLAVQLVSNAAYTELTQLVYGPAYSCEILLLKEITTDLSRFNSSNTHESLKREKMYQVYYELNDVIHQLGRRGNCH